MVAPTSMMVPSSITGRKQSCWARLKRWISSTNSSVPCPVSRRRARRLEHLLQVGDAGEDRRDLLEMQVGRLRQQPRHRGLAGAGRAPEDQRAERARRQHARQRAVRARADDPGRPPRRAWSGRSRSASGRGASLSRPAAANRSATALLARGLIRRTPAEICWPPRWMVMRQQPARLRGQRARGRCGLAIFCAVDRDDDVAAAGSRACWRSEPSSTSTTTTPSVGAVEPQLVGERRRQVGDLRARERRARAG